MEAEQVTLKRPKKSETLVSRVEARSYRRKLLARAKRLQHSRLITYGELFGLIILLLLTFWLLIPFFGQEDQVNVFSAPFFPILASLTSFIMPYAYGIRVWLLVFFAVFPFSFYYFVKEICKRKLTGFLASMIVMLPLSIFLFLRIELGILSQDGGQVAGLTLTMLVCLFLLKFLKTGSFNMVVASSLLSTLVALSSPLGLLVLLCFTLMITFSEMLLGQARTKIARYLVFCLLTAGFSSFWYNPKFIIMIIGSPEGQLAWKALINLFPISFFVLPLLGSFGFLLFENRPHLQPLFIASFLSIGFTAFYFGSGIPYSSPSRFIPALGISVAFLIALIVIWLFDFIRLSPRLDRFKLRRFQRRLIAISFTVFSFFLTIVLGLIFRSKLVELAELPPTSPIIVVSRIGIWEIRNATRGVGNIFGAIITLITISLAFFAYTWLKKRQQSNLNYQTS